MENTNLKQNNYTLTSNQWLHADTEELIDSSGTIDEEYSNEEGFISADQIVEMPKNEYWHDSMEELIDSSDAPKALKKSQ